MDRTSRCLVLKKGEHDLGGCLLLTLIQLVGITFTAELSEGKEGGPWILPRGEEGDNIRGLAEGRPA